MTTVTVAFAALLAAWMAWRGYRRGALATLVGRLPMLAALAVLLVLLRAAWSNPEHFSLLCLVGSIAAVTTFAAATLTVRVVRRRRAGASDTPGGRRATRRWLSLCNRGAGAALGVFCAALLLLALACLASSIPFAITLRAERDAAGRPSAASAAWVDALRRSCRAVADISHFGLLAHIPRMGRYSREIRSLITILNAPKEKLEYVARKHGLTKLTELREVQDALLDDEYMGLMARVGNGDLFALPHLIKSPITRNILQCPLMRELTSKLTPSQLVKDLEEATTEESKEPHEAGKSEKPEE